MKEDQSGHLYPLSDCKRDTDPPTPDINDRDEFWNMPELEYATFINDFENHNRHEIQYSGPPFLAASELFQSESELFTDKTIVESELPELLVCYKEINCVKDIGIDDRHQDNCSGLSVSIPPIELRQDVISERSLNFKPLRPDGPKTLSQEGIDERADEEWGSKEERGFKSLFSGNRECFPEDNVNKDGRSQEDWVQSGETNCNLPNKIENADSEVEYIPTTMLPLQEFGILNIPQSFMDSFNNVGDEVEQQPNQSPSMEANLENFAVVSKAEALNKNGPANKLVCSGNFESRTVTCDFDDSKLVSADFRGGSAEPIEPSWKSDDSLNHNVSRSAEASKPSLKSDYVLNHNGETTNDPLATNVDGEVVDIWQESMMNPKNRNNNNPFIDDGVQSSNMEGSTRNFDQEAVVNHKNWTSNNPFAFGEIQSSTAVGNIPQSPILNNEKGNSDPFAFSEIESANIHQLPMPEPENGKSNNPFSVSEVQHPDVHSESPHQLHVLFHEMGKTKNPFADMEVQSCSLAVGTENVHKKPELKLDDGDSSDPFAVSKVPSTRIDAITTNIHKNSHKLDRMPDNGDGADELLSTTRQDQSASSMAENNESLQEKSLKPQDLPNSEGTSTISSINNQGQFGVGESSFSSAWPPSGLITYSGPITYSGSTSVRSDSSTTSARSFAFPVLQSEWNSSPVRMRKAERRHFRKHKGWKQVIVCCKF